MASKFLIDIKQPKQKTKPARVRVTDCDQDENTGWLEAPLHLRDQPLTLILASVYVTSPAVQEMLDVASKVAYAVYLNEDNLDIHAFIAQAPALAATAAAACLNESLPSPTPPVVKSPRM